MLLCDQLHNNFYEHIYYPYYIDSPHNSKHLFDIYSLTHIFWLLLLSLISKNIFPDNIFAPIILVIISSYFEIHENLQEQIIKYRRIEIDSSGKSTYRGDTLLNSIGDIMANLVGIYIAYKYSNNIGVLILVLLFLIITNVVGLSYWTDFIGFLFN